MRLRKYFLLICIGAIGLFSSLGAHAAERGGSAGIVGTWRSDRGGEISIKPCSGTYCGYITVVAVPDHIYRKNKKQIEQVGEQNLPDVLNKDPKLRNRPLRGLQILTIEETAPPVYKGKLYNAEDGNTYDGVLTLRNASQIELSGCVLFNVVCRGEVWERVR